MIGKLFQATLRLGKAKGIDMLAGSIRPKDGRIIMFVPTFPGAHKSRYALRARVVWWLHTGDVVTGSVINIHHKNNDRQDDRFNNLQCMTHAEHSLLHNFVGRNSAEKTCKNCGKKFRINGWRLKDKTRGQYCTHVCFLSGPRSESHRAAIGRGVRRWLRSQR